MIWSIALGIMFMGFHMTKLIVEELGFKIDRIEALLGTQYPIIRKLHVENAKHIARHQLFGCRL